MCTMNVCDFKSTHMIVYDVLTGRRQEGEQESGTDYTMWPCIASLQIFLKWGKVVLVDLEKAQVLDKDLCFGEFLRCEKHLIMNKVLPSC